MLLQQQTDVPRYLRVLQRVHDIVPAWALGCFASLAFIAIMLLLVGAELKLAVKRAWSLWDVRQSAVLLQDEVTAEAGVRLLRDALVRTPDEPAVIRAFASLTEKAGMHRHARFFYQHLERRGAASPEDQLRHAAVVARLNDHRGAQVMLQAIAAREGPSPDLWRVEAEAAALRGDHSTARTVLQRLLAVVPDDPVAEFDLGQAEALSPDARRQQEGITRLLDLFEKTQRDYDPSRRNACLWSLAAMKIDDARQRQRFATLVAAVARQRLERLVLQRFLEASVDPSDPDRSRLHADLARLLGEHAGVGPAERLSVAKMLQSQGEHGLVLGWITPPLALKDQAMGVTRLDSLLAVQQWLPATNLIEHEDSPLPLPLKSIFRAQIELLAHGPESPQVGLLLRNALRDASQAGQQPPLVALARLASQFGQHQIAFDAYARAMSPSFPQAQFIVEALIREGRLGGGSAARVLQCLEAREDIEGWSREWQQQVAYFRLLCGERLELVESSLRREQDADSHFLAAFAAYRLGDTYQLRQRLTGSVTAPSATPVEKALLSALQVRVTSQDPRSPVPAELFDEERCLLRSLGSHAAAKTKTKTP